MTPNIIPQINFLSFLCFTNYYSYNPIIVYFSIHLFYISPYLPIHIYLSTNVYLSTSDPITSNFFTFFFFVFSFLFTMSLTFDKQEQFEMVFENLAEKLAQFKKYQKAIFQKIKILIEQNSTIVNLFKQSFLPNQEIFWPVFSTFFWTKLKPTQSCLPLSPPLSSFFIFLKALRLFLVSFTYLRRA